MVVGSSKRRTLKRARQKERKGRSGDLRLLPRKNGNRDQNLKGKGKENCAMGGYRGKGSPEKVQGVRERV